MRWFWTPAMDLNCFCIGMYSHYTIETLSQEGTIRLHGNLDAEIPARVTGRVSARYCAEQSYHYAVQGIV